MKKCKILIGLGVVLLAIGLFGLLIASVALARADEVPNVRMSEGVELKLSPDDPRVIQEKSRAETVLLGSLLISVSGIICLGSGWWLGKKARA